MEDKIRFSVCIVHPHMPVAGDFKRTLRQVPRSPHEDIEDILHCAHGVPCPFWFARDS